MTACIRNIYILRVKNASLDEIFRQLPDALIKLNSDLFKTETVKKKSEVKYSLRAKVSDCRRMIIRL